MTRALALACLLLSAACHREYATHVLPAENLQRAFGRPQSDAVLVADEHGQRVRISPRSTVRIVHHAGGAPKKARWLRASELGLSPSGLVVPGEGELAWPDIDALEARRIDKGKTLLWAFAGVGLACVCALYDCFGRVPR